MTQSAPRTATRRRPFISRAGLVVLKLLMIAFVCVSILEGVWLFETQREMQAAAELEQIGCTLNYACRFDSEIRFYVSPGERPRWLVPGDAIVVRVRLWHSSEKCLDQKLACLESLHGLRCLELSDAPITDVALQHIGCLARLEFLDLLNTAITDAGIRCLTSCSRLEQLSLYNTQITDASIPHIAKLTQLKWICLRGTAITPRGIARLQSLLPAVRIESEFDRNSFARPLHDVDGLSNHRTVPDGGTRQAQIKLHTLPKS